MIKLKKSAKNIRLWPFWLVLLYSLPISSLANTVNNRGFNGDTTHDEIFMLAEQPPTFPGGNEELNKFLSNNLKYPELAVKNNIKGRVYAQFVVEKDGSLSNFKAVNDPGSGLAEEALRVLKLSPKWNAGMQNGKVVRVQYTVPVRFALNNPPPAKEGPAPQDTLNNEVIFTAVQVNPSFPGGEEAFGKFLRENIRYPSKAKINNTTGRTFTQFVVEPDGSLTNFKTLRDPGNGLGEEALRVLKLCPKWIPGTQNGKAVRVLYTVPINFSLAR
ncbi:energy transducer TonB [Mucilaginibacter paludis]|uniref:TonB family protein n=1 Tax=Mucilaginibacter paludis DSM 18603 TaxID=714943 RepID=H1YH80_9SPHI|nr:energy transducer TonB [Mucilaginibacter paludis]EHQ24582.1 TonB family protein [Mucilaginibacter paludis DSM 18603]